MSETEFLRPDGERYEPADPGDFRFEITALEEPELGCTHLVVVIGDKGEVLERFTKRSSSVKACASRAASTAP